MDAAGSCAAGETRKQLCYDFAAWDYAVFGMLLLISTCIGLFFAIKSRKKAESSDDYLLGGRQMSAFPVSLSLTTSFMSAITVMGTPAEFYIYGTMYWYYAVTYLLVAIIVSEIYIPVLYRLGITSIYEYLEIRFSRSVRLLATTIFIFNTVIYIGICIYAPALALNEVTGLGVWWSAAVTAVVCTFYTTLGGLKAVVWTDVFQCLVMWIGFVAVLIKGSTELGGFSNIWAIAEKGGRIKFDSFQFDPTIRHTFWSITIGGTFIWTGTYGTTQSMVQRYLSCKSEKHARWAIFLNVIGLYIILILVGFSGLTMYAYYVGCDPYTEGWVGASDQLMPCFVLELLHDYPRSSWSVCLRCIEWNSKHCFHWNKRDGHCDGGRLHKTGQTADPSQKRNPIEVVYGVICLLMAVLASQISGGVLQAALSLSGLVAGATVGMFTLGMMLPWCNAIGAFVGVVCGLASTTWIYVGSTIYPPSNDKLNRLYLCTDMCNATADASCGFSSGNDIFTTTSSTTELTITQPPPIAAFYSLSYCYYPVIGFGVTVVTGLVTSFLTGYQRPSEVNPLTIRPVFDHPVFCWLPSKARRFLWCGVRHEDVKYDDDEKIRYLHHDDSVADDESKNRGRYAYSGESSTADKKRDGEKRATDSNIPVDVIRVNGSGDGRVNYAFRPDETSTSL